MTDRIAEIKAEIERDKCDVSPSDNYTRSMELLAEIERLRAEAKVMMGELREELQSLRLRIDHLESER